MMNRLHHTCNQRLGPALIEATCFSSVGWATTSSSLLFCPWCKRADQAESKFVKSGHLPKLNRSFKVHSSSEYKAHPIISIQPTWRIARQYSSKTSKCFSFLLLSLHYRHVDHPPTVLALVKQLPQHNHQILDTVSFQNHQFLSCLYKDSWRRKIASSGQVWRSNIKNNITYFDICPQNYPSPTSLIALCISDWL